MRFVVIALFMLGGSAPSMAGRTGSVARQPYHRVTIASSAKAKPVTARMLRLPYLRRIARDGGAQHAGLVSYRAARQRGRELRVRLGEVMRVRNLVKSDSFIVDRYDFRSSRPGERPKILIVGGVHSGSEPVGVEVALQFAESLAHDASVLEKFDITIVPLANPKGLLRTSKTISKKGTPGRYTTEGVDLNRAFAKGEWTAETRAIGRMLEHERFDAVLDLHGAGSQRNGFFAIRGGDDGGVAARFMSRLGRFPLLDQKGAGKNYRMTAPGVVTSSNRGTLKQFAFDAGSRLSYTFEAPSRLSAADQVAGQLAMVRAALTEVAAVTGR